MTSSHDHSALMVRAIRLARLGQGRVEPNPMVGCVIVDLDGMVVGEGHHTAFGAMHAEVEALREAGPAARGATMYVTLEPCCHHGKTPPCSDAIIAAGVRRVFVAQRDPFPKVDGGGIAALTAAGIEVHVGIEEAAAQRLNAPYLKLMRTGRPWVIAKWAMSLDGKLATAAGQSKWISNEQSRAVVHHLRDRMDAIIVGRGTVEADDPLLTARTSLATGDIVAISSDYMTPELRNFLTKTKKQFESEMRIRVATRIVLDSHATLSPESQLVKTAGETPVLVAASGEADDQRVKTLQQLGCEVLRLPGETPAARLDALLAELGGRSMTNVLVEGGSQVLGSLLDARAIDEVHVFIAPRLLGGAGAPSPIAGGGAAAVAESLALEEVALQRLGEDIWVHGLVHRPADEKSA